MRHMADDQLSDVYLKAAYAVARALTIRHNERTANTTEAWEVELATRSAERQLKYLEDFQTRGETVRSHGEKIAERSKKMTGAQRAMARKPGAHPTTMLSAPGAFYFVGVGLQPGLANPGTIGLIR